MRFKEFLSEADKSLLQGFRKNLDAIIDSDFILYRGDKTGHPTEINAGGRKVKALSVGKRTDSRSSLTSSNTLMDFSSTWEGVPSRKFSYFTTRNKDHAGNFGDKVYVIIPADNVKKFAYCPEDFNESNGKLPVKKNVDSLISQLTRLMRECNITVSSLNRRKDQGKVIAKTDAEEITKLESAAKKAKLKDFPKGEFGSGIPADQLQASAKFADLIRTEKFKGLIDIEYQIQNVNEVIADVGWSSVEEAIEDLNPETYGIVVASKLKDLPPPHGDDDEVWFEGGYIGFRWDGMMNTSNQKIINVLKQIRAEL